jgi:hypothetical protein
MGVFRVIGFLAIVVGIGALFLIGSETGFRFFESAEHATQAKAFRAQLEAMKADVEGALVYDGDDYASAVRRLENRATQIESLPFASVLRKEAQAGSEKRLIALGAMATLKSLAVEMQSTSLDAGASRGMAQAAIDLVDRLSSQSDTQQALYRRRGESILLTAVAVFVFCSLFFLVVELLRKA